MSSDANANASTDAANLEVADKLVAAFSNKDIAALRDVYDENAEIWHNYDGKTITVPEALARVEGVFRVFTQQTFENIRRIPTETGYVQQHDYLFVHNSGASLSIPACQVATVEGGKITRIEAYLDRAPLSAMIAANS